VTEPLPTPIEEQPTPPKLTELPPPVPDPAPIEQEKVQRDAVTPATTKVQQEQEEKRKKPEQAELDSQKQELSARDKLLQEIRKQRELAARDRSMAEQRAQQLADARTTAAPPSRPPPGDPNSRLRKSASYQVALMNAILRQWTRPDSVKLGQTCEVLIKQIPGGEVVSVQVSPGCPYDDLGRRSVEAAVMKASPLPYAGFEDVFVRDPVLKFRAEDL
jgi:colicin import membrane protein